MHKNIAFIDTEINGKGKISDIGALKGDAKYHSPSVRGLLEFVSGAGFICGHNIVNHDLKYLNSAELAKIPAIDTLYLSALLFPTRPYHRLVKDDKLNTNELNNPVNDCIRTRDLLYDEFNAFSRLTVNQKRIYCTLLGSLPEFNGFFKYMGFGGTYGAACLIKSEYAGKICQNADIAGVIKNNPAETAYALALIGTGDPCSVTPRWLNLRFPLIESIIILLTGTPCGQNCAYCENTFDIAANLKGIFGFDKFRDYDGLPLQELAVKEAINGGSLLAVFPTGGGKSLTFQLPALISGKASHGLTVVLSPLQALMKDQVDVLKRRGILEAAAINGLLNPIDRKKMLEHAKDGSANILYISPEQLRSQTIENLLLSRNVVRFVIDEAHCFSAWGQDFRVDYQYIGDFIKSLQQKKGRAGAIPVSCFTATAKPDVIGDIKAHLLQKTGLKLKTFVAGSARKNLEFSVINTTDGKPKFEELVRLIEQERCPAIVYVSRVRRTGALVAELKKHGIAAMAYHGKMNSVARERVQDEFISGRTDVIVATSAFGMGVDKSDVGLVVHYDISSSLESYVQEAGRAGRDPNINAKCVILFDKEADLNKHFVLNNQTRINKREIQQIWTAVKKLAGKTPRISRSTLEIARAAGWDDTAGDIDTRVKTALCALENAGYIRRGKNMPRVFATSIQAKNMEEASRAIKQSMHIPSVQKMQAERIISHLISKKSRAGAGNDDAESRVDHIADILGMDIGDVIRIVNGLRREGVLDYWEDMDALIPPDGTKKKTDNILSRFAKSESLLLERLKREGAVYNLKELNGDLFWGKPAADGVMNLKTLIYYYALNKCLYKREFGNSSSVWLKPAKDIGELKARFDLRRQLCAHIADSVYEKAELVQAGEDGGKTVLFSLTGLWNELKKKSGKKTEITDIEDALLYMSNIDSLKIEGGFLVLYNRLEIERLQKDNRVKYKDEEYRALSEFYAQKTRNIHIVGEYADILSGDAGAAAKFSADYFKLSQKDFLGRYFKGRNIDRNITQEKYDRLYGSLSDIQKQIISDDKSQYIVVAAGPGSGKTRVLAHKLTSLLQLEEVKHEQLLMLTFSRAAATEFKKRLIELVGNAAHRVCIKTFHSYAYDVLGRAGNLEEINGVLQTAAQEIAAGNTEPLLIQKSVLVIDEAQDMGAEEYALVCALMAANPEMRVIAAGDDDQCIYEFKGADICHMKNLIEEFGAKMYSMTQNYRSKANIVALANAFAKTLPARLKREPIEAMDRQPGIVKVIRHNDANMEQAIAEQILNDPPKGSACVLARTNEGALKAVQALTARGIKPKLIKSLNDPGLYFKNLVEVRFILNEIKKGAACDIISDELWGSVRQSFEKHYGQSSCYAVCKNFMQDFEATRQTKYLTDLEGFAAESKYEDFYDAAGEGVYVSTLHKAKGREFDSVYIMAGDLNGAEKRRVMYVGITRAKNALYIHTDRNIFPEPGVAGFIYERDENKYPPVSQISQELTLRDVVLSFVNNNKDFILKYVRSGMPLIWQGPLLYAVQGERREPVARLSRAGAAKVKCMESMGYAPHAAKVGFVTSRRPHEEGAPKETAVVLPVLYFKKPHNYR